MFNVPVSHAALTRVSVTLHVSGYLKSNSLLWCFIQKVVCHPVALIGFIFDNLVNVL